MTIPELVHIIQYPGMNMRRNVLNLVNRGLMEATSDFQLEMSGGGRRPKEAFRITATGYMEFKALKDSLELYGIKIA